MISYVRGQDIFESIVAVIYGILNEFLLCFQVSTISGNNSIVRM